MRSAAIVIGLTAIFANGCGPRDYYVKTETGPHGTVTSRKIYYTPEQLASRNELFTPTTRPADATLAEIEERWPKLTPAQRAAVLEQVKTLSEQK